MKKLPILLLILFSSILLILTIVYFIFSYNYRTTQNISIEFGHNACIENDYFLPNLITFVDSQATQLSSKPHKIKDHDTIVWNIIRDDFGFNNSKICFEPNNNIKPDTKYELKYKWLLQDFNINIEVKDFDHKIDYQSLKESQGESIKIISQSKNIEYFISIFVDNTEIVNQCTKIGDEVTCQLLSEQLVSKLKSNAPAEKIVLNTSIYGEYKGEIDIEILSALIFFQGKDFVDIIDINSGFGINKLGHAMIFGYSENNAPIHAYLLNKEICNNISQSKNNISENVVGDTNDLFEDKIETTFFYFGAIHGSEGNTAQLMDKWKNDLITYCKAIPESTNIIIIPSINPDGVAANYRFNKNQVDINRNFDTKDWQQITYLTDGETFPNGGGNIPFSEKETQLIRDVILQTQPQLTISFHSWGRVIVPADMDLSYTYANYYSQLSGYYVEGLYQKESSFNYITTGSFNVWMAENNLSALTIELWDLQNDDWGRNRLALWDTITDINQLDFLSADIANHKI